MSQPPVGIDLGTTYSALAVINSAGKPEIVPNQDGRRTTASVVLFEDDGEIMVGEHAKDGAALSPGRSVSCVKRLMGDEDWSIRIDGRRYTAVEISAEILRKIKRDAEATIGPLRRAVITVPAYFDEVRRKATMDAAAKAGMEVLRIINEPTAAAIAYAYALGRQGQILVYDFGGGTFDVSIVSIKGKAEVEVIASDGDHALGGSDLDEAIANHLVKQLQKETGATIEPGSTEWLMLLRDAEGYKRSLSKLKRVPARAQSGTQLVNVQLTRELVEKLIQDYILRTQMLVESALAEANLQPGQIDDVLLVGGSTRLPAVTNMLEKKFSKPPVSPVNVDEAVALGAALQAGVLMAQRGEIEDVAVATQMAQTKIQDVASHSYGTLAVAEFHGSLALRNSIIIRKNSRIPTDISKTYYTMVDGQQSIECQVTQGEDESPEFLNIIREGEMNLPAGLPEGSPIDITYSYDANMRMRCTFVERSSGRKREFIVDQAGGETRPEDPQKDQVDEADFDDLML